MALILLGLLLALPADSFLATAGFDGGLGDFEQAAGDFALAGGEASSGAGKLVSKRQFSGDLRIDVAFTTEQGRLAVSVGGRPVECLLSSGPDARVELRSAGELVATAALGAELSAPAVLTVMTRSGTVEALVDGRPLVCHVGRDPLPGGSIAIAVAAGPVRLDQIAVRRLPWKDGVELIGDTAERADRLVGQPVERFSLLPPLPARIDPEYRVAVTGEDEPLVVRFSGVRRTADDLPLLNQALALLRIRPHLRVEVLQGEQESAVPGETEFGPFVVSDSPVIVVADGLLGIAGEWPAVTIWNGERILDRTLPGGPAGRAARAEIPADCERVRVVLSCPGRESIEREVVIRRQ